MTDDSLAAIQRDADRRREYALLIAGGLEHGVCPTCHGNVMKTEAIQKFYFEGSETTTIYVCRRCPTRHRIIAADDGSAVSWLREVV